MTSFQNRIVRTCETDPKTLLEHPLNARVHPPEQSRIVKAMFSEFGWIGEILVSQQTGRILDGHLRVKIAVQFGEESVPVRYVNVTEEEEALIVATFDQVGAMAAIDHHAVLQVSKQAEVENAIVRAVIAADAHASNRIIQAEQERAEASAKRSVKPPAGEEFITIKVGPYSLPLRSEVFTDWYEREIQSLGAEGGAEEIRKRLGI